MVQDKKKLNMRVYANFSFTVLCAVALFLLRCATEPGSGTPVAGGAVTFTYQTGDVRVLVDVQGWERAIQPVMEQKAK